MLFAKFDLDSTLVNTDDLISLALAEQGYMLDPNNHDRFNFNFLDGYAPPPDFQWEVFFYRLLVERLDELEPVDPWTNEFLEKIYDGKNPIHVITARSQGVMMHHACMSTLERCFPNVEFYVTIVKSGDEKIKYMGLCDFMFEDRRKTALQLSKEGNIVIMPNKEYNQIPCDESNFVADVRHCGTPDPGDILRFDNYGDVLSSVIPLLVAT